MSRIGNRILNLPKDVNVEVSDQNLVTVSGPKGKLKKWMSNFIEIKINDNKLSTLRKNDEKKIKQLHGTTNSLILGMIEGVTKGFEKKLEIVGVGYKASLKDKILSLSLGHSHPIEYTIPENITVSVPKPIQIIISGIDKQLVGEVAAQIRKFRRPEPYKGKGVKYIDEYIIRKEGKSAGK